MADALQVPVTLTSSVTITVSDRAVLDLTRGESFYGKPFEDVDELLQHLARNLIAQGLPLSSLDGWADLPDDAVTVSVGDVEAEIHWRITYA